LENFKNPSRFGKLLKNYNKNKVLITKRRGGTDTGAHMASDRETVRGDIFIITVARHGTEFFD